MKNAKNVKSTKVIGKKYGHAAVVGLYCAGMLGASPASARTLEGVANLSQPLTHATIRVLDPSGHVIAEQADATNENGYFSVTIPGEGTASLELQATGGELNGLTFEGTLYGQTGTDPDQILTHLNAGTTLATLYQQHDPGASREEAEARVQNFLGLSDLVSLRSGIENPYLRSFSAQTLLDTALASGGWNTYTRELAVEMAKSSDTTREFPAAVGLQSNSGSMMWIGEKLLAGVMGDIGSKIFNQFLSGIGFPSGNEEILGVLNKVMAEIAEIRKQLNVMEVAIKQVDYDIRSSDLRKTYGEYITIVDKMNELNIIAEANTNKVTRQPISAAKTAEIAKTTHTFMEQIMAKDMKLISNVHTEFTNSGDATPLQQVFAEVKLGQVVVVNSDYMKLVSDQVDQYRGYQAVVTAILVDAIRAEKGKESVEAQTVLNTALKYINEEKPIYPNHLFFKDTNRVNKTIAGKIFYQKNTNLVWATGYMKFESCDAFTKNQNNPNAEFRSPGYDEMVSIFNETGTRGNSVKDAVQKWGFPKSDAEAIRMITFHCGFKKVNKKNVMHYNWFGNDQQGPWSQYYNDEAWFSKIRTDKQM